MELIATVGSATATSYCTVAEAYNLLRPTIDTDLTATPFVEQLHDALIWATRLIEEQVDWYWSPLTTTQALSWPLDGAVDPRGRVLSLVVIPAFLKQATAEYALHLLRGAKRRMDATVTTTTLQGLKSLTIDDVRMEVATDMQTQVAQVAEAVHMPPEVRRLLRPYGDVAGDVTVRLVRT